MIFSFLRLNEKKIRLRGGFRHKRGFSIKIKFLMKKDNFSKKFKFYRTRNKNSHIHLYFKTQPCLVDFGPKSNGGNASYALEKILLCSNTG